MNGEKQQPSDNHSAPPKKKTKLEASATAAAAASSTVIVDIVKKLLQQDDANESLLPTQLLLCDNNKIGNSLDALQQVLNTTVGFRTNVITSPRAAVSIYKDSCIIASSSNSGSNENSGDDPFQHAKTYWITILGLHPQQEYFEQCYAASIKELYTFQLFLDRLQQVVVDKAWEYNNSALQKLVCENRQRLLRSSSSLQHQLQATAALIPGIVTSIMEACVAADPRIRIEQLVRELERIQVWNSTFSNALLQRFCNHHEMSIKDVFFKRSEHAKQYERITIYLYDSTIDLLKPPRFTFLPALTRALSSGGPEAIVTNMVESFWNHLLVQHGYYCTSILKETLSRSLYNYFLGGLLPNSTIPLNLQARFSPTVPLAIYLDGPAGTGKSSLVRSFAPALHATLAHYLDPEIMVRLVKQLLNKPHDVLELELELRPNNNDLSVMKIIQGRRMTMTQTKPGLVVVNLEEVPFPNSDNDNDPNQVHVCRLLSQRFSGRKAEYNSSNDHNGKAPPRNSTKRGISGDASIILLMTSNYKLHPDSRSALEKLHMFSTLQEMTMHGIAGQDRQDFSVAYLRQCIDKNQNDKTESWLLDLQIPLGDGDTRPLVRHLRMLAFYVSLLRTNNGNVKNNMAMVNTSSTTDAATIGSTIQIVQDNSGCTVRVGTESMELRLGSLDNLYPKTSPDNTTNELSSSDARTAKVMQALCQDDKLKDVMTEYSLELPQILDFYFFKTLAPAVVVSHNRRLIRALVRAIGSADDDSRVHCIPNILPSEYKMMKSLYDPTNTPNLRDDILRLTRGSTAYCAVELCCTEENADQLCIREMLEDSPSMTAFSTHKSALYKEGLFFGVYIPEGTDITPEVHSRTSLIL